MQSELDTQQTEIMGRNRLVNELIAAGIEVSIPIRDSGIDVIAYRALASLRNTVEPTT